jgi:hypothetical protein
LEITGETVAAVAIFATVTTAFFETGCMVLVLVLECSPNYPAVSQVCNDQLFLCISEIVGKGGGFLLWFYCVCVEVVGKGGGFFWWWFYCGCVEVVGKGGGFLWWWLYWVCVEVVG